MEPLILAHSKLTKDANLGRSIDHVQKIIDTLTTARKSIAEEPQSKSIKLAQLQNPVKQAVDQVGKDFNAVYKAQDTYGKAVRQLFKDKPLMSEENDALVAHPELVNQAIAMHLLREGQFGVASTFSEEAKTHLPHAKQNAIHSEAYIEQALQKDLANGIMDAEALQREFAKMFQILHELKHNRNLTPAIRWARKQSGELETNGSNLEFELCRLNFVGMFLDQITDGTFQERNDGPLRAWAYARSEFELFQHRYAKEINQLMGTLAFSENLQDSPYRRYFYYDGAWEEVASSFTREFCSLLGLSADSPLYIAATAGAIALPKLLKLQKAMKDTRTEWTSQNELPVEIPLPPAYHFHSIFVCPVSKEQGTDENPPMMMPCGHVICQESLDRLSKGSRFKCPYCPCESHSRDATRVYL